jgi:hypothetical protein
VKGFVNGLNSLGSFLEQFKFTSVSCNPRKRSKFPWAALKSVLIFGVRGGRKSPILALIRWVDLRLYDGPDYRRGVCPASRYKYSSSGAAGRHSGGKFQGGSRP